MASALKVVDRYMVTAKKGAENISGVERKLG
jgi:hypothetical protein